MKEFVDFNSKTLVKSQCMGNYSIINMINKNTWPYHHLFAIKSLRMGTITDNGCLHPHFIKMGDGHFADSGPFDGELRY